MQIIVNDAPMDVAEPLTVSALITLLDKTDAGVAVAVNQEIQLRADWESRELRNGDNILLFQAIAGG
ncbi:MAG: sulfur carrier protein ThiS [Enterobacteriaceae bacterium]|jgi:sulfur carrier protein|nr:sulfur carrier protein ThiS [Enterobacteriaceae bacterium]